jgi:hypothetical protein
LKNVTVLFEWSLPNTALLTVNQSGAIISMESSAKKPSATETKQTWMEEAYRKL